MSFWGKGEEDNAECAEDVSRCCSAVCVWENGTHLEGTQMEMDKG